MVWFDRTKQSGGKAFYLRKSEPILIFGKVNKKYNWDTFEVEGDRGDQMREKHVCPKPVNLFGQLIERQTKNESIILDVFGGSGTTLISTEGLNRDEDKPETNRICYIMELDPDYCSLIIQRWEELTGKRATKIEI